MLDFGIAKAAGRRRSHAYRHHRRHDRVHGARTRPRRCSATSGATSGRSASCSTRCSPARACSPAADDYELLQAIVERPVPPLPARDIRRERRARRASSRGRSNAIRAAATPTPARWRMRSSRSAADARPATVRLPRLAAADRACRDRRPRSLVIAAVAAPVCGPGDRAARVRRAQRHAARSAAARGSRSLWRSVRARHQSRTRHSRRPGAREPLAAHLPDDQHHHRRRRARTCRSA